MQVIAGSTSIELSREISDLKKWSLLIPEYKRFGDGENYIRIKDDIEKEVLIVQSLYYPQETFLFQLLNLVSTVKRLGAAKIHVFTPYLCYARADREVLSGEAISSRTVFQLMESVGVDHLIVIDIHNPEISKYTMIKITNIFPILAIKSYIESLNQDINEFLIVAPDAGAKERADTYAKALGINSTNLVKHRDPITGDVGVGIGSAEITSNKILLIDDIMATGSSLVKAASLLKLYDIETIHIFVAHALGTAAVDRLLEIGNGTVVATASIPNAIGKLSLAKDLVKIFTGN